MIYVEVSEHGGYPQIIHFLNMIFHEINHPFWGTQGYPHFRKPQYIGPAATWLLSPELVEAPFPNSWINQPDSFIFFLLLILGINIIRNMQGFWIAKLDFPDVFCMERSSHPLSNPWHHTPKWSKMNNLIQPLKQGVWRGVRYWRHGVQTECLRIWWGIITLW